ncbi:MAG: T9SS type A sorting domain-containing protein [Cyanobacteria bacterium RU_5_0]|nr:T9SS type A sorting domain-containing protein [Cyanobacteria bacterium RU_5_0]
MARDPGNSRQAAKQIGISNRPRTFRDRIGERDRFDVYRFSLKTRSSFKLDLKGLKTNADVLLLNNRGRVIGRSNREGRRNEAITIDLNQGTYFVQVNARGRTTTRYRLILRSNTITLPSPSPGSPVPSPSPGSPIPSPGPGGGSNSPAPLPNTAPTLLANLGVSVTRGGSGAIGGTLLQATDPEQQASQLVYTLTNLPKSGQLRLNGTPLTLNASFTQDDLNNNRVIYQQPNQLANEVSLSGTPKISGSNVVWAASDGTDTEIFFYNGTTGIVSQITSNDVDDLNPQISGFNIVWQSGIDTAAEIFFYNASTGEPTKRLSDNDNFEDTNPQISGLNVVWERKRTNDSDVRLYVVGTSTRSNSIGSLNDIATQPLISGSHVAFEQINSTGNVGGIYLYNIDTGRTPELLTRRVSDKLTAISGSIAVWERTKGSDKDIFYFKDGEDEAISDSVVLDDSSALISDSFIAFQRNHTSDNTQDGLYLFDVETKLIKQITTSASDTLSGISGSNLVWTRSDGTDTEIFFYNGATSQTIALTNNLLNDSDPLVSGSNVVWLSGTSSTANQISLNNATATSDTFGFSISDGASATTGTFNITIG